MNSNLPRLGEVRQYGEAPRRGGLEEWCLDGPRRGG